MTGTETVRAGRRTLDIHRPDKAMFPADGGDREYTKGDLVDYYVAVAPFMLPHLRGRPLMLERHPDGMNGPQFMQKNVPDHYPDWIKRVEVAKEGGTVTHVVCDDTATLAYLADQACITPHRWSSRVGRLDRPDRLVFDLDPMTGDDFGTVREAAHHLGALLSELRLPSALMTTGSRGLHVVVPLGGHHGFEVRVHVCVPNKRGRSGFRPCRAPISDWERVPAGGPVTERAHSLTARPAGRAEAGMSAACRERQPRRTAADGRGFVLVVCVHWHPGRRCRPSRRPAPTARRPPQDDSALTAD